jgi:hypothetical protein
LLYFFQKKNEVVGRYNRLQEVHNLFPDIPKHRTRIRQALLIFFIRIQTRQIFHQTPPSTLRTKDVGGTGKRAVL